MATQAEVTALLNITKDQLVSANARIAAATEGIAKVGTETDTLNQKIKDLEDAVNNQTNASPELVAAVTALQEASTAQGAALDALAAGVTAADDKVPDAATPPPA